jgi:hypothetical protein
MKNGAIGANGANGANNIFNYRGQMNALEVRPED